MNRVVLVGRLTKDSELRFTLGTGRAVETFTLAVNRRYKSQGQPDVDFIPIIVWGKQTENTANYVVKGKLVGISGMIQTRNYEAKDGTRRYVTEVVTDEIQFLDHANSNNSNGNSSSTNNSYAGEFGGYENDITPIDDEDIPF